MLYMNVEYVENLIIYFLQFDALNIALVIQFCIVFCTTDIIYSIFIENYPLCNLAFLGFFLQIQGENKLCMYIFF